MSRFTTSLVALVALLACRTSRPITQVEHRGAPETLRTLKQGRVIGGDGDAHTQVWLGIPFAAPPVGALRWRAPQPPGHWEGVREATAFGPACSQPGGLLAADGSSDGSFTGSEDCLTLNVWAPAAQAGDVPQAAQRLPVMLWIHGGGNSLGSTRYYDPARVASEQHVIVVTTQYRLGPLGWFRHRSLRAESADPLDQSGNFGTLDLVAALHWVRENAAAFGGDPGNVTLFGESAGAQNVLSLLLSPTAKGLFHRAILESGGPWSSTPAQAEAFTDDPDPGAANSSNEILARLLVGDGLARDRAEAKQRLAAMSDAEVAQYLHGKSPAQLMAVYSPLRAGLHMIDVPTVLHDGVVLPAGDFLEQLASPDGWNRVPVLIGTNRDEMKLFLFLDRTRIHLRFGFLPRYVNEPDYQVTADVLSRLWRTVGADQPVAAMRRSGATDLYEYRFDWKGERRPFGIDLPGMVGAAHGVEIPFLFGRFDMESLSDLFGDDDRVEREKLGDAMRGYWGAFARSGSPGQGGAAWPEWKAWGAGGTPQFLVLDAATAGGVRMNAGQESIHQILEDLSHDSRASTPVARCRVLHELASWGRGFSRADYAQAGCAEFPYDAFPWKD